MKKMMQYFKFTKGGDGMITTSMLILAFVGILMTVSTTVGIEKNVSGVLSYAIKQLGFVVVGVLSMNFISNVFVFQKFEKKYYNYAMIMLTLLFATLLFPSVNGAKAWIHLPLGLSFQPSEFFKIFVIVLIGVCVEKTRHLNISFKNAFMPVFIIAGIGVLVILILQKDFGTAVITLGIIYCLLMIPYHPNFTKRQSSLMLFMFTAILVIFIFLTNLGLDIFIKIMNNPNKPNYQILRFVAARNPFEVASAAGYQLIFGLEAIARGGFFGVGYGNSTIKFLIPEGRTDYIMSILIEESGLLGFFFVSFVMFVIVYRLIYFALRAKNESYKMILMGVALYFILHYVLNVGGISGLIPLTGVPLLMISAGGTSLIAVFLGIGISQRIIATVKRDLNERKV